jgi:N-methylhydantoinase A/oxoprolinase/acetone carboxylase beta subunit
LFDKYKGEKTMSIGIGIDTGGTYTDAVVYDYTNRKVLAKGKSLTTKENLAIGIAGALDFLPTELLSQANMIALSTTLATNACVENKGGRAKLLLMGTSRKVLEWVDAKATYGIKCEDVICMDTKANEQPDFDTLIKNENDWFLDAQALSIAEINAMENGGIFEKSAKEKLSEQYHVPIVMASELVSGLNVLERGATALLNARLLPVIEEFMSAVSHVMKARGLDIPAMIVRSDGSLMVDQLSCIRPVETILSGPASSIIGGRGLAHCENSLIVDMGGTTTDISIVKENEPAMTGGIRIGGWRTQIKGVFIDTFGLGGDSRIYMKDGKITLSERKVQPLCIAATKWPAFKTELQKLLAQSTIYADPYYEFFYLVREPKEINQYSSSEIDLITKLRNGPIMLGSDAIDLYHLKSERLEEEGVIMRCGLTPTDIMHIKGDFSIHDKEAAILGARYFLNALPQYEDTDECLTTFCNDVYELVSQKLYENIVRILLVNHYPQRYANGLDEQLSFLISQSWQSRDKRENQFFDFHFDTTATLIGIGAPTHIFLPEVAKALGTDYIIPEHAEVANAVGAITADITAKAEIKIAPNYDVEGTSSYTVYLDTGNKVVVSLEDAIEEAKKAAILIATAEAKQRGALGELTVETKVDTNIAYAKGSLAIDLGTTVTAIACGRVDV